MPPELIFGQLPVFFKDNKLKNYFPNSKSSLHTISVT